MLDLEKRSIVRELNTIEDKLLKSEVKKEDGVELKVGDTVKYCSNTSIRSFGKIGVVHSFTKKRLWVKDEETGAKVLRSFSNVKIN